MSGPLQGLRVIDCSRGTAGPRMTGLLADYGADVIWVEPPGGDDARGYLAVPYSVFNRGKRSVTLDLRAGTDRLMPLLADADLFVESWRPGQAADLGLSYEQLHERFPALIHCSISGFGLTGPYRDLPGYEAIVHAVIGTMAEQMGHREPPIFPGIPFASIGAAYLGAIGSLAALYRRSLDGVGRHVETSMLDGALSYLALFWGYAEFDQDPEPRDWEKDFVKSRGTRLVTGSFLCADGEYLGVHTGAVGAFGRLMRVLGLDDRIPPTAEGNEMGIPLSQQETAILDDELHGLFLERTSAEWVEALAEADVCAIPQLRPGRIFDEPQVKVNRATVTVDDPVLGVVEQVGPPIRLWATPPQVAGPAPVAGAHTDEVLAEITATPRPRQWLGSGPADGGPVLAGVKVLDMGAYFAGPYASRLLADLGADVIKLEPVSGDPLRGAQSRSRELGRMFRVAQAGKRALTMDLKSEELRPALNRLMGWADIIHHGMRPGAAERLGAGYQDAIAANPQVIYGHACGWGSEGPNALRQSFEPLMSGYVGAGYEVCGQFNPPIYPAGSADPGNGLVGAIAMLLALVRRQVTGEGQRFENPQLNATMTHVSHIVRTVEGEVIGADRLDPLQLGFSAQERLYETADGWICLVARERHLGPLGEVLGIDILSDPRFAAPESRYANDYALSELISETLLKHETPTWLLKLREAGVPCAVPSEYNNLAFLAHPDNHRSGRVSEFHDPDLGVIRELAHLLRMSHSSTVPHRLAPKLGEHTRAILREVGYSDERIDELRQAGRLVVRD